jgi:N-carbamoylputrescine amidase
MMARTNRNHHQGGVVRVGLVQTRCGPDPAANLDGAVAGVHQAADRGAQIVCLPELFRTEYFCQTEEVSRFDLAESIPGPTTERLSAEAARRQVVVIAPVFERRAAGVYHNSAVVFDADGRQAGLYRKMHIPDDPSYYEKFYFTPGDLGFLSFDTCYAKIGVLICWDQWFSEAARLTALAGAEILFYPTAIGWLAEDKHTVGPAQHNAWETVQRGHAIGNGVFVAAVNRVGHEGDDRAGIDFWGQSFLCDPSGVVLARGSSSEAEVLVADCDRQKPEQTRRYWPFLRDRRIDAYGGLLQRYGV